MPNTFRKIFKDNKTKGMKRNGKEPNPNTQKKEE